tara:strand:+ start:15 stop:281 length:267 start_codon:yes stop_codon:yes gene_type:complete
MAGEGFIAHMIASLKTNKRSRVSTFDKIKDFKKSKKSELFFPNKATKKDLKKVREKIQKQNNISFFKNVSFIIITIIILYFLIQLDRY